MNLNTRDKIILVKRTTMCLMMKNTNHFMNITMGSCNVSSIRIQRVLHIRKRNIFNKKLFVGANQKIHLHKWMPMDDGVQLGFQLVNDIESSIVIIFINT